MRINSASMKRILFHRGILDGNSGRTHIISRSKCVPSFSQRAPPNAFRNSTMLRMYSVGMPKESASRAKARVEHIQEGKTNAKTDEPEEIVEKKMRLSDVSSKVSKYFDSFAE